MRRRTIAEHSPPTIAVAQTDAGIRIYELDPDGVECFGTYATAADAWAALDLIDAPLFS